MRTEAEKSAARLEVGAGDEGLAAVVRRVGGQLHAGYESPEQT